MCTYCLGPNEGVGAVISGVVWLCGQQTATTIQLPAAGLRPQSNYILNTPKGRCVSYQKKRAHELNIPYTHR